MAKTGPKPKSINERFWSKVDRRGENECWNWTARLTSFGYGRIGTGGRYGDMMHAHRASYLIHYGPIPDGLVVMHICDNRRCVNPAHLKLGTQADNLRDMYDKHRNAPNPSMPGNLHPQAISVDVVQEALRLRKYGLTQEQVAEKLNISKGSVYNIDKKKHWSLTP
jgi:hypothetical protein